MRPKNGQGPPEKVKPGACHARPNQKLVDTTTNAFKGNTSGQPEAFDPVAAARRRRQASYRLPGGDPWHPYRGRVGGYPEAVQHLAALGLAAYPDVDELRAMYRAGGSTRLLAQRIAEYWQLAA